MLTTAVVLWQQKAMFQFEKKMLFTKLAILEQFGYSFIDFGLM